MHIADMFKQNGRIRNPLDIDTLVQLGYEKLGNIGGGNIFEASVKDFLLPKVFSQKLT